MSDSTLEIRKLCPELMQDFLLFFDGEAFADNPKWGFCYCQFLYVDHAKVDGRLARSKRIAPPPAIESATIGWRATSLTVTESRLAGAMRRLAR